MERARGTAGGAWLAAGLLLACEGVPAWGWPTAESWSPGVSAAMRFERPPLGASEGGEWIGALTPQLVIERPGPLTRVSLRAHRRYDSSERARALRTSHDVASASFGHQLAERARLSLDGAYYRSRDLQHPDPESPVTPSETRTGWASAHVALWRGEVAYRGARREYEEVTRSDAGSDTWAASLFPRRSEATQWLVALRRHAWTLAGRTDLAASVGTVGLRRRHSSLWSSELEVGIVETRDDFAATRRRAAAVVAGTRGLGLALGLPFDLALRLVQEVATTGVAEAWRSFAGARLGLRWERSLEAEGGVFEEPTRRDFVAFEAQDTLAGPTVLALQVSYRRAQPRAFAVPRVETWRGGASISRDIRPWLTGRLRYSRASQSGSGVATASAFGRDRVELSLTAAYR